MRLFIPSQLEHSQRDARLDCSALPRDRMLTIVLLVLCARSYVIEDEMLQYLVARVAPTESTGSAAAASPSASPAPAASASPAGSESSASPPAPV